MKPSISVNIDGFSDAIKAARLSLQDMMDIEGAGAKVIINKQRELVPYMKSTGATKASIMSHVIVMSETDFEDDIGPETDYAPYIEYGVVSKPNYPIQPFIRPSVEGGQQAIISNVMSTCFGLIVSNKWPK